MLPSQREKAEGLSEYTTAERQHILQLIYMNAPVLLMGFDNNFRCLLWNPECEDKLEWTFQEINAVENMFDYLFPDPRHRKDAEKKILDSDGRFYEFRVFSRGGESRRQKWATFKVSAQLFFIIGYDITFQKESDSAYRKSQQQLQSLSSHLQTVREEERSRISRDIHDELGQMMSLLQIDLNWLQQRLAPQDPAASQKIDSMYRLMASIIEWVRRISQELRPSILDNLGLAAALEWQAEEFQKQTGIICQFITNFEIPQLNDQISTALFRIFQEALTNVMRHAQASRVEVNLQQQDDSIRFDIVDDGIGISKEKIDDPRSFGLIGMQERVRALQGQFHIHGTSGQGTRLNIKLPLHEETDDD